MHKTEKNAVLKGLIFQRGKTEQIHKQVNYILCRMVVSVTERKIMSWKGYAGERVGAAAKASPLSRHSKDGRVWTLGTAARRASQKERREECKGPEAGEGHAQPHLPACLARLIAARVPQATLLSHSFPPRSVCSYPTAARMTL